MSKEASKPRFMTAHNVDISLSMYVYIYNY